MIRSLAVAMALFLLPALAQADELYLSGTVGSSQVLLLLQRHGALLSGSYVYLRHGKQIRLDGSVDDAGHFTMTEKLYGTTAVNGTFQGTVQGLQWTGTWTNAKGGPPLALALGENRDRLASESGHFACNPHLADAAAGYTFNESLALALAQGVVTKLAVSHGAVGNGDEQMCGIALKDLERVSSPTGILLRAKGDDAEDLSGNHCAVRIVAAGDFLYLEMGDPTQDGNDCHGAGDEMFCTPRGNWNDLVLNRKTRACTMVQ